MNIDFSSIEPNFSKATGAGGGGLQTGIHDVTLQLKSAFLPNNAINLLTTDKFEITFHTGVLLSTEPNLYAVLTSQE